jgi:hypothetical protein
MHKYSEYMDGDTKRDNSTRHVDLSRIAEIALMAPYHLRALSYQTKQSAESHTLGAHKGGGGGDGHATTKWPQATQLASHRAPAPSDRQSAGRVARTLGCTRAHCTHTGNVKREACQVHRFCVQCHVKNIVSSLLPRHRSHPIYLKIP